MCNIRNYLKIITILIILQISFIGCNSTSVIKSTNTDYLYCEDLNYKTKKNYPKCSETSKKNQICTLEISDLRPTQFNYGQKYINNMFKEITNYPDEIANIYCKNTFNIVIGPSSEKGFFIVDNHHQILLASELYKNKNYKIKLLFKVKNNYALERPKISQEEFWFDMKNNNLVYLKDKGNLRSFDELPLKITNLTNDPYRSLVEFIAEDKSKFCFDKNLENFTNYAEFYWADYFRSFNGLTKYDDFISYRKFKNKIIFFNMESDLKNICKINLASSLPGYSKQNNLKGTLVVDKIDNILQKPDNFRKFNQILKLNNVNKVGIKNLNVSGSAQFSKEELRWIINNTRKNLLVVDLRQEPHGFINNNPVTWTNVNNWINFGQLKNNILIDEAMRLQELYDLEYIQVPRAKDFKNGTFHKSKLVRLKISSVEREDQIVKEFNAKYYRITVSDHARPSDNDVDEFLKLIKNLDSNTWIHFHCRAGKGRTSTFLLMFDIIKNAKNVSYEDILTRQNKIFPKYQFFKKKSEKYKELYQERVRFIREFYNFSKSYDANSNMTWTQWKSIKN